VRLLIVDDSLVVRNAIQRSVDEGKIAQVFRAEDGEEAVAIFARERPELVTMDLTLPRLDGLGAIRSIRELAPATSILVISALNSHKTAMEAIALGACGFLTKPFTPREIAEALDHLTEHAATREQTT
jgi:two-component system, chemotaxis family, chemotaxis protein CheY